MKYLRKLVFAIALVGLLAALSIGVRAETYSGNCGANGDNVTWSLDTETGLVKIAGNGAMKDYSSGYIPFWYDYGTYIKTITIVDGVTSIGNYAFYKCTSLTSVEISNSVTSVGNSAFNGCHSLTSVSIGDSVTNIGGCAFMHCTSLKSVGIPNSVTSIGPNAFYNCTKLTGVYITDLAAWCKISFSPDYSNPLWYAHKLYVDGELVTELIIPNTVTGIEKYAFQYCESLTSVEIPSGVTSIEEAAFASCTSLTSVNIGNSVTNMGGYAFTYCTSLESVCIGNGVTAIGQMAFNQCTSLMSISVASDNLYYSSDDSGVLFNKDKTTLIQYPRGKSSSTYSIPTSVTRIGDHAFRSCTSLISVEIPTSVTRIESQAFYGCTRLTSVGIPNSVTSIGKSAFSGCTGLTSVEIPHSITYIGAYAFSESTSLKDVYYGGTQTEWGDISIGDGNTCLTNADIQFIIASGDCGDNVTWRLNSEGVLTISGTGDMENYSSGDAPWYVYRDSIKTATIGEGVTSIGEWAFSNCLCLRDVTISDSVDSIGRGAFSDCTNLEKITISEGIVSIGDSAFYDCTSLTNVFIPASVVSIGYDAFCGCGSLTGFSVDASNTSFSNDSDGVLFDKTQKTLIQYPIGNERSNYKIPEGTISISDDAFWGSRLCSITIPDGVASIGAWAFCNCTSLAGVDIPKSVSSIGICAFRYCTSLVRISVASDNEHYSSCPSGALFNKDKTVLIQYPTGNASLNYTIPDGVLRIESGAFSVCVALTDVTIPNSVNSIGEGAFFGCTGLSGITIPSGVTSIEGSTFHGCTSLISLDMGIGVTGIGDDAFGFCTSLASIVVPDKVISIGRYAFSDCSNLTSVSIGAGVTSIEEDAFSGCDNLTSVFFLGNAPTCKAVSSSSHSFPTTTTLYYIPGTTGWTDTEDYDAGAGTWKGYHLAKWEGQHIAGAVLNDNVLTVTLGNGDTTEKTVSLLVASYDEAGRLLSSKMETASIAGEDAVEVAVSLPELEGTKNLKVFLADQDMQPVCSCVHLELPQA